ncbi:protein phosphatase 2C domain-containing protein [Micromonospora antibiotica]|nr:protein phosphatase 2C domain-containing protein [Micromonospora antibiotica]
MVPNEDWAVAGERLILVLDGATARTGTGCEHGVAWYAAKLGSALAGLAVDRDTPLADALAQGIRSVAEQHRHSCDLDHPGTPSAAIAVLRPRDGSLEFLVLGDVTVVIDTADGIRVVTDDRVDGTARAEREEVNRHPFGTVAKQAALLRMKHAELAARNRPGGYWVAAADPTAASYAITGDVPLDNVRRVAVLTDGAARPVALFDLLTWADVLDVLDREGPVALIRRVRASEAADPACLRWPRNKCSDDATAVYACTG